MQKDAIWIIDDDEEDHDLIKEIFKELELPNKLEFFKGAEALLERLEKVHSSPFIIFCDVNIPRINGFELREILLGKPEKKFHSVPFIFWSNQASENQIMRAYDLKAHGFFVKEARFQDWKDSLICIVRYWQKSRMPSKKE